MPIGDGDAIDVLDMGLVEKGVMGAPGGGGILAGRDGVDGAGAADGVPDGDGEIVPTDPAFVAVVKDPGGESGGFYRECAWGDLCV